MTPSEMQSNILAGQLLVVSSQKVSASLDNFSGWLVTGYGAALIFLIANLDTVSQFISPHSIKWAAFLFVSSAALAVLNKMFAAFILAGTTAAIDGAAVGKDLAEREIEFDIPALFAETKKALFWPGSALAERAFAKAGTGDFAGPGRMYTKAVQLQGVTVIIQALVSLAAAVIIVRGLSI